ncbi:hypothetical protein Y023_5141 [Burkholderia pseudomallei A79D]|nr:hypothetical protein Y023_5141 [Burkholderia pseudomallei A79D]KGX97342.1 hypothetical protein X997_4824 [Burkholderia pseudomallei A79C]
MRRQRIEVHRTARDEVRQRECAGEFDAAAVVHVDRQRVSHAAPPRARAPRWRRVPRRSHRARFGTCRRWPLRAVRHG